MSNPARVPVSHLTQNDLAEATLVLLGRRFRLAQYPWMADNLFTSQPLRWVSDQKPADQVLGSFGNRVPTLSVEVVLASLNLFK